MNWFWNWGGECFGYRDGDSLFTYFGREAGRFDGEEIYGSNGRYLGEVVSDNRLITSLFIDMSLSPCSGGCLARMSWRRGAGGRAVRR